jgi:hypothetical protein
MNSICRKSQNKLTQSGNFPEEGLMVLVERIEFDMILAEREREREREKKSSSYVF